MPTSLTLDRILEPLNEEQRKAVEHTNGPTFILAGAGSGKTRALTHRIAYLMHNGVEPWQILAVTFTNKAASEMKERVQSLLSITAESSEFIMQNKELSAAKIPTMGTFHSVCVRILRRDIEQLGRDRNFVIYDADDQQKLMREVLKEMHIDESELKPRAALGYIGRFKAEAMSPKDAEKDATTARLEQVVRVYAHYQKKLRESNALDFDDLILETVHLFYECSKVLDRYQETWRYLHVDEYQDTNHAQYLFITLLAQKYRNLCVIGDPDQSIYAFRGADIRNILEFKKEYPDAVEIKLERNYRSTQPILTAADGVISPNPNRPEKKMWTERTDGPHVLIHEVEHERSEAEEALRAVEAKKREGLTLNEQVILYRTNAQSRLFEEACMRFGIPYRIVGGFKFYARKEVKDILAYLYLLLNPQDTVSLLRVINVPGRKIGQTTLDKIQTYANAHGLTLWETLEEIQNVSALSQPKQEVLQRFTHLIKEYRIKSEHDTVSNLTQKLIEDLGLERWLRDETEEGEERWQNIQELISVMHKYDTLPPQSSLMFFLEEVALVSEVDKLNEAKDDALTLMTLHLCKGLEFEHVIIGGCEEGIFPHSSSSFDHAQLEEERRLMYVGMTRAKTHLHILCAQQRMLWGNTQNNAPSRFLDDLPETVVERKSHSVLSSFGWKPASTALGVHKKVEPYRQHKEIDIEFNQDIDWSEMDSQIHDLEEGSRVHHPTFGTGTIMSRNGDIVDIQFDGGERKKFALSIAPLKAV